MPLTRTANRDSLGHAADVAPRVRARPLRCLIVTLLAVALAYRPALAVPPSGANDIPAARYAVRLERSMMIPMRDGVRLSTDLYFPEGAQGPLPVILIRTPYNKNDWREPIGTNRWMEARIFASQGYVVAVQDVRGKWESEGAFSINSTVLHDFPDTMDWLAAQAWSNGRIATYGCSYLGENQIIEATVRHPRHLAMVPQAAGGGVGGAAGRYRQFGVRNGGAFELGMGLGWFMSYGSRIHVRPDPVVDRETFLRIAPLFTFGAQTPDYDFDEAVRSLPLRDLPARFGAPPTDWNDYLTWPADDPRWDARGYLNADDRIDTPALHVNSWYDYGVADTIAARNFFAEHGETARARDNQYLLIGPGAHCRNEFAEADTPVGARDVGDARLPFWRIYLAWFDRWLRGDEHALDNMPHVTYFLLGANEWRTSDVFPPAGTRTTAFFLGSGGRANSLFGDGTLSLQGADSPEDGFVYDPENPVPTLGGPLCCTRGDDLPAGSFDQREIEARNDILIYQTEPLEAGVDVVGPLRLVLYVSSDAPDTDFTARLIDVYPDGRAFNVQEGIQRVRYRNGPRPAAPMQPGQVYEVPIDLQATANRFGPGHRIRLEVSSSSFPRWDRNLNTGEDNFDETDWRIARNTVHHSARYPSRLILPIAPGGEEVNAP